MKHLFRLFLLTVLLGGAGVQTSCSWGDFMEFFAGTSFDTRPYRTIGFLEVPREWEPMVTRELNDKGYNVALGGSPNAFVRVMITNVECVLVDADGIKVYDHHKEKKDKKEYKRPFCHYYEAEAFFSLVDPQGRVIYASSRTSSPRKTEWEAMRSAVDSAIFSLPSYGEYPGKYNGKGE